MTARLLPYALLAVALLFGKCVYDGRRRAEGREQVAAQRIEAQRQVIADLRDSLARQQTAQTETLRVAVVRRVPVRDTVERWLHDTIPVPVEVVREIVRVDSVVIAACMLTLSTCEARVSALEADLNLSQRQTALYRRRSQPSLLTRISTAGKWLAVGYLIGVTR